MRRDSAARWTVLAFCGLNVLTALAANGPRSWDARPAGPLGRAWSRYANALGLDNRWEMFGRLSRYDWRLRVEALDADGRARLLPLPLQGERTLAQRAFFDFRDAKLYLNLYGNAPLRAAYAAALCRRFPAAAVRFTLDYGLIRPPERAAGPLPPPGERPLETVPCARP
jgi:hypothetical protein